MEGGGTNGSHLPADMTCRDVGHGSVALLRARRYRSEQLLSGTVEESICRAWSTKGCYPNGPRVPSHATRRRPTRSPCAGRRRRSNCSRAGRPCLLLPSPCRHACHARAPQRSMSPSPRAAPGQLPRGGSYRSLPSHVPRGALHPRDPPLAGRRRLRGAHVAAIRSTPTLAPEVSIAPPRPIASELALQDEMRISP